MINISTFRLMLIVFGSAIFLISWLFGFEPQTTVGSGIDYIPNFTFREYLKGSMEVNGSSSWWVKVLTTIAYPGAKAGRIVHNLMFARHREGSRK